MRASSRVFELRLPSCRGTAILWYQLRSQRLFEKLQWVLKLLWRVQQLRRWLWIWWLSDGQFLRWRGISNGWFLRWRSVSKWWFLWWRSIPTRRILWRGRLLPEHRALVLFGQTLWSDPVVPRLRSRDGTSLVSQTTSGTALQVTSVHPYQH